MYYCKKHWSKKDWSRAFLSRGTNLGVVTELPNRSLLDDTLTDKTAVGLSDDDDPFASLDHYG